MRTVLTSFALLLLIACGGGTSQTGPGQPPAPVDSGLRIIQLSGTVPTTDLLLAGKPALEQSPFDGALFALKAGRVVFQAASYSEAALAGDAANLPRINSAKLRDNFLLMRGETEAGFDLFDDGQWGVAEANIRAFARMAKLGGLQGIAFDPEAYSPYLGLFAYSSYSGHSFAQCQAQVRLRGQQFMAAVQQEYPGSRVFLLGGLSLLKLILEDVHAGTTSFDAALPASPYGLMPAWLNGLLDAIQPGMELIDGNETTYTYYHGTWYAYERGVVQGEGLPLIDPANRVKAASQLKLAMSIYLDASFLQYDNASFLAHYLTAAQRADFFQYQAYWALKSTDRYLWVYSEHADWIPRANIPAGAETALASARAKVEGGQDLGLPSLETELQAAAVAGGLAW